MGLTRRRAAAPLFHQRPPTASTSPPHARAPPPRPNALGRSGVAPERPRAGAVNLQQRCDAATRTSPPTVLRSLRTARKTMRRAWRGWRSRCHRQRSPNQAAGVPQPQPAGRNFSVTHALQEHSLTPGFRRTVLSVGHLQSTLHQVHAALPTISIRPCLNAFMRAATWPPTAPGRSAAAAAGARRDHAEVLAKPRNLDEPLRAVLVEELVDELLGLDLHREAE